MDKQAWSRCRGRLALACSERMAVHLLSASPAPQPRCLPNPSRRYELHSEFSEALDHAQDRGKNTKILLKVNDVGQQYE